MSLSVVHVSRFERLAPWFGGLLALAPLIWCHQAFSEVWWFGDDWDLLDQIARVGFVKWTLVAFAENFVPLFKLLWGGMVFVSGGSYFAMICALWLTHALNVALFVSLLRMALRGPERRSRRWCSDSARVILKPSLGPCSGPRFSPPPSFCWPPTGT